MMSDWDTWQEHIRIAAETAGYTYETFVEGIQANSDVIREDSDLTRAQIEYDTMQMEGYIDQVIGSVEDWKFSWVGEMDVMIDKTLELINMIDALRSAMTGEQYDSTIDYSIKMAESYARGDAGAALRYADLREQKIVGDNMTQEQWQDTTEYLRDLFVRGFSLGDADALAEAVERGFGNVVEQFRRITGLRSGGYTGEWGQSNGRLAILHQKELVLNPEDTQNFLSATYLLRDVMGAAGDGLAEKAKAMSSLAGLAAPVYNGSDNVVQQVVSIDASFPGVQSAIEIENALNNLVNEASQYAAVKTL